MQFIKNIFSTLISIHIALGFIAAQQHYLVTHLDLQMDFVQDSLVNESKEVEEFLITIDTTNSEISIFENVGVAEWEEEESNAAEEELLKKIIALVEGDVYRFPFTFSIEDLYSGKENLLNLSAYQDSVAAFAAQTVSLFASHLEMDKKMQKQVTEQLIEYFDHRTSKIINKFATAATQMLYPTVYLQNLEEENWTLDTTTTLLPVFNQTLLDTISIQLAAEQQIKDNQTVWSIKKNYDIPQLLKQAKLVQPLFNEINEEELIFLEKVEITLSDDMIYEKYAHEQFFKIPGMKIVQVKTIFIQAVNYE